MIYISTSCVKNDKIKDSVESLALHGFKNIELSGGTRYYDHLHLDLLELKDKYNLNFQCHNYFPPPKQDFVVNLASLNNNVFNQSLNHLINSIQLSKLLGAKKFGFHAGFFIDISPGQIGGAISNGPLFNEGEATLRFIDGYKMLQKEADCIGLYIENNVFSKKNRETYPNNNPFMMTTCEQYRIMRKKINFSLLLDVAHLKVSARTLGLDFECEFKEMIQQSNYIHVSENDGYCDSNMMLSNSSSIISLLGACDVKSKDFTLEVYDNIDAIKKSYEALEEVVS